MTTHKVGITISLLRYYCMNAEFAGTLRNQDACSPYEMKRVYKTTWEKKCNKTDVQNLKEQLPYYIRTQQFLQPSLERVTSNPQLQHNNVKSVTTKSKWPPQADAAAAATYVMVQIYLHPLPTIVPIWSINGLWYLFTTPRLFPLDDQSPCKYFQNHRNANQNNDTTSVCLLPFIIGFQDVESSVYVDYAENDSCIPNWMVVEVPVDSVFVIWFWPQKQSKRLNKQNHSFLSTIKTQINW